MTLGTCFTTSLTSPMSLTQFGTTPLATSGVWEIYNYWIYIVLMMIGFYGVIAKRNLVKKVICLGLFQTGIFIFYISLAVHIGGVAPISDFSGTQDFANPLPHVLILTAIVVSVSITAVALAIVVNIRRRYGTVEIDEIEAMEEDSVE